MQTPATPINETQRLKSLHALGILDTLPDTAFDQYTKLAACSLNMPIALVSLVDRDRQWFKSCQGLDVRETPRDISFCGHAILGDDTFIVRDAATDIRFHDNPLVTGDLGIRFYAGQPLRARDGQRIGTLCVIDRRPRDFTALDRRVLVQIAGKIEQELAVLSQATTDAVTQLANRQGFDSMATRSLDWCRQRNLPGCVGVIQIDGVPAFADEFGQPATDAVIRQFSDHLVTVFQRSDILGRALPGEFRFFTPDGSEDSALDALDRLAARCAGSVRGMLAPSPVWHAGTVDIAQAPKADLRRLTAMATERLESCRSLQRALQRELSGIS